MPLFSIFNKKSSPTNTLYNPNTDTSRTAGSQFKAGGSDGVQFFGGFITGEEYLPDLEREKGIEIYDRMRRSDAQVKGTLNAITLPIRQVKWYVEPASDSSKDVEIAERIEKNLFREMLITWDDFLRQALNYLPFGFSVFEKVLQVTEDNFILLKKLAPRLQKTIHRWYRDSNGDLKEVEQYVQMPDTGAFEYIRIPVKKVLLFTNEQEGSNYEGISVLRAAYKHWFIKDTLYKIDAIGHDRFASGVPVATEPDEGANQGDSDKVATILQNLHSRERSYLHLPGRWKLDLFEKKTSNTSILSSIQHHNEEIGKNVLAQFINLGTTSSGSRSLGESFEELFMQSLNAVAGYIADNMNRKVIAQLVEMNWGTKVERPILRHSRILLNISRWLQGLASVGLGNAVSNDNDIENILRSTLGFPELSKEAMKKRDEMRDNMIQVSRDDSKDPGDGNGDGNGEIGEKKEPGKPVEKEKIKDSKKDDQENSKVNIGIDINKHLGQRQRRKLTDIETALADFDEIEITMNNSVDKFNKQVMKIKREQAKVLASEVLTKSADKIKVPFIGKLADRLFEEAKRNMRKGRRHVIEEINRQKQIKKDSKLKAPELITGDDYQDEESVDKFLKDKSIADSTVISNKTLGIALFALYNIDQNKSKEDKEKSIYEQIISTGNSDVNNIANAAVNKAYSMGREVEAEQLSDTIEVAMYSAALDSGACETCRPLDGHIHDINDPSYQTPNPSCKGGDRCRCINIYKIKDLDLEGFNE